MDCTTPIVPSAPPPPTLYEVGLNDATEWKSSGMISNDEALDALREHCKNLCCWGEGPIDKMKIQTLEPSTAYKVHMHQLHRSRHRVYFVKNHIIFL